MVKKTAFEGSVEYWQVLDESGKADKKLETKLDDAELKRMYGHMVLCRLFDRKAVSLQRQGRMYTYAPLEGQEASQVGAMHALAQEDVVFPTYRDHGSYLVRGAPLENLFEYWMGYEEGLKMPAGVNVFPLSITVGNHLPMAAGMAWSMKLRKRPLMSMVCFGDGATSEGDFHEAFNFSSVHKTPLVLLCQNNHWAISVPLKKQMASETVAQKALSYGAWGVQVDGNDVLAVYSAVKEARRRALAGDGPSLVECLTYRMSMHTTADDPKKYRSDAEVDEWKKRDPLARFEAYLASRKLWTPQYKADVEADATARIEAAVKTAEAFSAQPEAMFDFVFEKRPPSLQAQRDAFVKGE
ncbi:pyruvate dehydrogenase (acetyl-transferring) E1 component subunit alpha [Candidatus Micrarchaeota archaeon]|nr:pyruvate dehydrogenase (acetyl-transferring) E1 component subunit alpha [Candidatus Micrarchaeota archaeon]